MELNIYAGDTEKIVISDLKDMGYPIDSGKVVIDINTPFKITKYTNIDGGVAEIILTGIETNQTPGSYKFSLSLEREKERKTLEIGKLTILSKL